VATPTPLRIIPSDFRYYKNLDAWQQYIAKGQPINIFIVCDQVVLQQSLPERQQEKVRVGAKDPIKGKMIDILA